MAGQARSRATRWFQERPSPFPWEQDGLDHVRKLMPQSDPFRAWATFSFTAPSGRVNECDLLIATHTGLYLVELKGHPGRLINNRDTWTFVDDTGHRRYLPNPLHLIDQKSKELKGRLEHAARKLKIDPKIRIPRVEPAIFVSAPGLRAELDEVQEAKVYARDNNSAGLPWIWKDLLGMPPRRDPTAMREASKLLPDLLAEIGIRVATSHLRFGDDWNLHREVLDIGPTWEDRLAERKGLVRERGRVRIYLTAQQATEDDQASVQRAAQREYQVLQGIAHPGIAQALDLRQHGNGPAILFRHGSNDLRLDTFLQVHGEKLTAAVRLDLVRQLAEAVRYAHSRSLYHRALAARSVYVSAKPDGSNPTARIIDWQSAARDPETTGLSAIQASSLPGRHSGDVGVYLAPESEQQFADPVDLDVFGLGALAYLVLSGQAPAARREELISRLQGEGGLRPSAAADGISPALDDLVFGATRSDVNERLDSAEAFLDELQRPSADDASAVVLPDQSVDPLTALPKQEVDGDWEVVKVLGSGATARALFVQRLIERDDGETDFQDRVLKVALDEDKAEVLRAEARTLQEVGGGSIVRLIGDGPLEIGGRTALALTFAGEPSLGAYLRAEGRLSYHDLERFGKDLFSALDNLAGHGVWHRDLKPENFGILKRADRSRQLVLFDFSLSHVSEKDVSVGTRGYKDPFIETDRRPRYDNQAEWYAAAVTLYEMASGVRPVWGDSASDPRMASDELPAIASDLFDPALRDHLTAFFSRALHRDVDRRFETLRQLEDAWRSVFVQADAIAPATTPETVGLESSDLISTREAHALAAQLGTPLEAAGLSPRAVSVAQDLGATTVGELLAVQAYLITRARGSGAKVRKELNRRHKQWSARLKPAVEKAETPVKKSSGPRTVTPSPRPAPRFDPGEIEVKATWVPSIDELADLVTKPVGRRNSSRDRVVRLTLGWPITEDSKAGEQEPRTPWPMQSQVTEWVSLNQGTVSNHQQAAAKSWAETPVMESVRDEIVDIVTDAGRVMTVQEVAAALRVRRGAGDDTPERIAAASLAVVRAAVEAELWIDRHGDVDRFDPEDAEIDGGDDRPRESRLAVRRRGSRTAGVSGGGTVLILAESLSGTDDPAPDELTAYAVELGKVADRLGATDPLPGRGVVLRDLRAVPAPHGLDLLADTRLVELAVGLAVSSIAASPRLEIYPTDLDLDRALRISQAASALPPGGISQEVLLARVQARFPELQIPPSLTYVRVTEALRAADFNLEYDTTTGVFRYPERGLVPSTSISRSVLSHPVHSSGRSSSVELADAKFRAGIERGGFLALTLRGRHLPGTAAALAERYPVQATDLNALFLKKFQELTAENKVEWGRVLNLDARFTPTQPIGAGLTTYVREAWARTQPLLVASASASVDDASATQVLFLHDAGLLARYWDQGGRDLLVLLQNSARRPTEIPHGMWLLCPGEHARQSPQLDHRIVEVLGDHERVILDDDVNAWLHGHQQERNAG